jgi:hypothetical protein
MKTIKINKLRLAEEIIANSHLVGNDDWGIYTNITGSLICRHSTHVNKGWFEIYNFYSGYPTSHDDDPAEFADLFDNRWLYGIEEKINYEQPIYELEWA